MILERVLYVGDLESDFELIKQYLQPDESDLHFQLFWTSSFSRAINAMLKREFDAFIVHETLEGEPSDRLFHEAYRSNAHLPTVLLSDERYGHLRTKVSKLRASDYFVKEEIIPAVLQRSIGYIASHSRELENIKAREQTFKTLFDRSTDPMLITDSFGYITEANRAMQFFMGLSAYELVSTNFASYIPDQRKYSEYLAFLESTGDVKDMKLLLSNNRGANKCCDISTFIKIAQHGEKTQYFSVLRQTDDRNACLGCDFVTERDEKDIIKDLANPLECLKCAVEGLQNDPGNVKLLETIRLNSILIQEYVDGQMAELQNDRS